jgi:hypothetical protein
MAKPPTVINFKASVYSLRTMVDGGINVTLSLSVGDTKQITQLLQCKEKMALLEIAAIPVIISNGGDNAEKANDYKNERRKRRYPYRD